MVMLNVFLFTSVTAIRGNGEGQGNFSNDGKNVFWFLFCFLFLVRLFLRAKLY